MVEERRLFIDLDKNSLDEPAGPGTGREYLLAPEAAHYLKDVLRLRPGATITALDRRSGRAFSAEIVALGKGATLLLREELETRVPRGRVASLSVGLLKGDHNDLVCEKACELGACAVLFWQAERSVVKLGGHDAVERKASRLRRISEAAALQSKKAMPPRVEVTSDLAALLEVIASIGRPEERRMYCSLEEDSIDIRRAAGEPAAAHLIVGPEGDLAPEECRLLRDAGFIPVSLGPFRLRSETAAISAVATINALWGFD